MYVDFNKQTLVWSIFKHLIKLLGSWINGFKVCSVCYTCHMVQ
jgi:hypothetical protein